METRVELMATSPVQTSMTILEMARTGRFADICELFAPQLRTMVSAEALRSAWEAGLDQCGPLSSFTEPLSEPAGPGVVTVKVPLICQEGGMTLAVSVHDSGFLTGLQLLPASAAAPVAPWEPPDYADPDSFYEQDVTLHDGALVVPGTLSLPHRAGPRPAIVLMAGSGPMDRDETIGRNKPFKDLAWGLATRGVTVLRFDKVTYGHPGEVRQVPGFTASDEYGPDTGAAINLLREHPSVLAERVFLLGTAWAAPSLPG